MPNIRLSDNTVKYFKNPITIYDVAKNISSTLSSNAIIGCVNGKFVDINFLIKKDCNLSIITNMTKDSLHVLRHSTAHLLAHAVKILFPTVQIAIGPVIENGFYYDFYSERSFTPSDLDNIEKKMKEIVKQNYPITRREISKEEAIYYFKKLKEKYKLHIIQGISNSKSISLYKQDNFEDMCLGPHVPSTGYLKIFKLIKVSGVYWKGNAKNEMLQRIYGTAWTNKEDLKNYLKHIEEIQHRDHRKIGKILNLFHFQEIAPGMVFWHNKGWTIYNILKQYIRDKIKEFGYIEVSTPQLVDMQLWKDSGHWKNFKKNMFIVKNKNRKLIIKPMSCPCHIQIYNNTLHSYKELPIRISEFGNCHRCEPSGSLHGLMRVRNMIQDDAHIFCAENDIQSEISMILDLVKLIYSDFGFSEILYNLALRPKQRIGNKEIWDKSENFLKIAMNKKNIIWNNILEEGAFYGPKIECSLKDCLGRIWQCGTIQIDFSMPKRLCSFYIDQNNTRQVPIMIHRAILGSFERFLGILIEHYAGYFPLWLSPIQVMVLPISEKHHTYAHTIIKLLKKQNIRVEYDLRNENIAFKIRKYTLEKVPYLVIIGDKETSSNSISIRNYYGYCVNKIDINKFYKILKYEIKTKKKNKKIYI